jgi:hypothetical protein
VTYRQNDGAIFRPICQSIAGISLLRKNPPFCQ